MKRFNFYIPGSQLKWLRRKSKKAGISVSELIRRAIHYDMQRAGKNAKNR